MESINSLDNDYITLKCKELTGWVSDDNSLKTYYRKLAEMGQDSAVGEWYRYSDENETNPVIDARVDDKTKNYNFVCKAIKEDEDLKSFKKQLEEANIRFLDSMDLFNNCKLCKADIYLQKSYRVTPAKGDIHYLMGEIEQTTSMRKFEELRKSFFQIWESEHKDITALETYCELTAEKLMMFLDSYKLIEKAKKYIGGKNMQYVSLNKELKVKLTTLIKLLTKLYNDSPDDILVQFNLAKALDYYDKIFGLPSRSIRLKKELLQELANRALSKELENYYKNYTQIKCEDGMEK